MVEKIIYTPQPRTPGRFCKSRSDCNSGICSDSVCIGGEMGDPCKNNQDCQGSMNCDNGKVCSDGSWGTSCTTTRCQLPFVCESHGSGKYCALKDKLCRDDECTCRQGNCTTKLKGASCRYGHGHGTQDCESGACYGWICQDKNPGSGCEADYDCFSGKCIKNICRPDGKENSLNPFPDSQYWTNFVNDEKIKDILEKDNFPTDGIKDFVLKLRLQIAHALNDLKGDTSMSTKSLLQNWNGLQFIMDHYRPYP